MQLLRRIMLDEKRRLAHSFAVSYEMEVGSSFDPNMEDLERWEDPTFRSCFADILKHSPPTSEPFADDELL